MSARLHRDRWLWERGCWPSYTFWLCIASGAGADYNVAADRIELNYAVFAGLVDGALAAAAFAGN